MASFVTDDDSASYDATGRSRYHAQQGPGHLTLGSVAESFRSEDYEPAPPGVDPNMWNEMIRKDRNQQQPRRGEEGERDEDSLLDDRQYRQYANDQRANETSDPDHSQERVQQSGHTLEDEQQQRSYLATTNNTSNSLSQSYSREEQDEQSRSTEQSGDRTELLSERLPSTRGGGRDSTMNREEEGTDAGDETGGDSALLRRATTATNQRGARGSGNLGNGQNMTLREQEKVRTLSSFLEGFCSQLISNRSQPSSPTYCCNRSLMN